MRKYVGVYFVCANCLELVACRIRAGRINQVVYCLVCDRAYTITLTIHEEEDHENS